MFVSMPSDTARLRQALTALRILLAVLIAIHGWHRALDGGVVPFGGWLDSLGLPFGFWLAAGVTAVEILGTPLYALGRFVLPLSAVYIGIYTLGAWLVHLPAGWFVVGSGRNGVEFSVLLIGALACVAWQYLARR